MQRASVLVTDLPIVEKHNVIEVVTGKHGNYTVAQVCTNLPKHLWPAGAMTMAAQ